MILTDSRPRFFEQLDAEIHQRLTGQVAVDVQVFAHQFYENYPLSELRDRKLRDVYGALFGSWSFIQTPGEDDKLRLFNPDFEKHGWQSPYTVLAVHCVDMPFIVDSLRQELNRRAITIHTIHSTIITTERDAQGLLVQLASPDLRRRHGNGLVNEALVYIEISRHTDAAALEEMRATLVEILAEVRLVVGDFEAMVNQARHCLAQVDSWLSPLEVEDVDEVREFFTWLVDNHFTFLGHEELRVNTHKGKTTVTQLEGSALGLLRQRTTTSTQELAAALHRAERPQDLWPDHIHFDKSSVRARVHRDAYPLYISLREFDGKGRVLAEHRFLGLFTSTAYTNPTRHIPIVSRKVARVVQQSGLDVFSHDGKQLVRVLEVHPRDELFLTPVDELYRLAMAVNAIQERRQVRLFMRRERSGKFFSCFVYTPKDVYRTDLRKKIQQILGDAVGAVESEFTTYFSESILTRTHFLLKVNQTAEVSVDIPALEREIIQACKSWQDSLRESLIDEFGEEAGNALAFRFGEAFPPGYQHDFDPLLAINDIKRCHTLGASQTLNLIFYRLMEDAATTVRLRLYQWASPLPLSDVIPILEHMGLRVLSETPYEVRAREAEAIWIHDFLLEYSLRGSVELSRVRDKVQEAFLRIWSGDAESDNFNKLLLGSVLDWRQVSLLRAYSRYMKQIRISFGSDYIADTLARYMDITGILLDLFATRFDPDAFVLDTVRELQEQRLKETFLQALDRVENLNEDQIFRIYAELVFATLRTNFYQRDEAGQPKPYVSFKLAPAQISDMPKPRPRFEIFVYSPWVEGVHLRGGKVARGGLRWSDRLEDFRTEVLGLVKAQQVKNAVIVPVGAKGGFVAKKLPVTGSRDQIQAEGIRCYRTFVSALLDLTDNLVEGQVMPPPRVLRKDEDDVYLVVAADKGTATFSDIANEIAAAHGFWLGDGFASGGSNGYDHKKMGITARGAWVSVQRHFRERGLDTQSQDFTVVGIGDMSGDVFGNGMLMSEHICLVAAFNHQHIFIDPNPEAVASFRERQRLFGLPRSTWDDYDKSLISPGGGVFSRGAKSIAISPEMKVVFAIDADRLTPNELISALLRAPVDLLWNGGIGTYIKASQENHADAGDKSNDPLRVNGNELRCKVIGEGGNLGMTQLARIEYGLAGGALNTDFIDNSAGVDCSDHEVNIKILLNECVASGDLTEKQRRELLAQMTDEVAALVLRNNYRQTLAISIAERDVVQRLGEYRRLIQGMEQRGKLDRGLEFLPDEETLAERRLQGRGLTRPELNILHAYVKGELKELLAASTIAEDACIAAAAETAFPVTLVQRFPEGVSRHRLHREIVATQVANDMVNLMGITYVERMRQSLGVDVATIARAYITAREVFGLTRLWQQIEALDHQVPATLQLDMMADLMRLVRRGSRWFIRNRRAEINPAQKIEAFQGDVASISSGLSALLRGEASNEWQRKFERLRTSGVPDGLAGVLAGCNSLYASLGISEAARRSGASLALVSQVYFLLGEFLSLDWFNQQIADIRVDNHWQALARESYRDDLEWQQSSLTCSVLKYVQQEGDINAGLCAWSQRQGNMLDRWQQMVYELRQTENKDFAIFSVANRELLDLAQTSLHCD